MSSQNNCQNCPVWNQSLFQGITPELLQWLQAHKKISTCQKKQALFEQGQEVAGIYCHLSGLVKVTQRDNTDKVRFSRLVFPGDTSGHRSLFIADNYKGTANVVSDQLRACFISKSDVLYLLANSPEFARNLVTKISNELRRSEEEQILVKEKSVRARLALMLLNLCEHYAEQVTAGQYMLKSEITKRDIASLLAVANETVIRLMSEMRAQNLIDYQERKIVINDIGKLQHLAGLESV